VGTKKTQLKNKEKESKMARFRRSMRKGRSKRYFRRSAGMHPMNFKSPRLTSRGGTRL